MDRLLPPFADAETEVFLLPGGGVGFAANLPSSTAPPALPASPLAPPAPSQVLLTHTAFQGDPGRPLVCEKNGPWIQIGIVSWGVGCGRRNQAGIYTNVSSYFNWIQMLVGHSTPRPDPSQLLLPLALLWAP